MLQVHLYKHITNCLITHIIPTDSHNNFASHVNFWGIIITRRQLPKKVLSLTNPYASSIYKRIELKWLEVAIFKPNVQSLQVTVAALGCCIS